jgi:putative peptide zinc metalloprotease protein
MEAENLQGLLNPHSQYSGSPSADCDPISAPDPQQYYVIPLSVQKEENFYVVGNTDLGDFYQFPEQGVRILQMLRSGDTAATIKSRLAADDPETIDVDGFLSQLTDIEFIYPQSRRKIVQDRLQIAAKDSRRTLNVDPRLARAIFSVPSLVCYLAVVLYASLDAIENPQLRVNVNAFYIESNKTPLLFVLIALSMIHTVMHELGHMLAAAREGIKSKYGISNRLWNIVAESDLTGILTLPKSKRYLPMLAGLLVDILVVSLLTILLDALLRHGVGPFTIQVVQVLVLEILITMAWQFNVFVKTDIYFVICNYFSYPDLDRDARTYLRDILNRTSFGRLGHRAAPKVFRYLTVLRAFSVIWLLGRILSLCILFGVFLPTMWQYLLAASRLLSGPPASVWMACDTILYVTTTLTMLGAGMYMWLKNR